MFFSNLFSKSKVKQDKLDPKKLKLAIAKAIKVNLIINKNFIKEENYTCVSLGENCNSSWYLKETGNKSSSYPFDWLFSSPSIICDLIEKNFDPFLNKKLIIEKKNKKSAGHLLYHNSLFNHKNPLNNLEDFSYYERCVERFKTTLKSNQNIIFVCNVLNEFEKRKSWFNGFSKDHKITKNQSLDEFERMILLIKSINPNSKFLFIEQYTESKFDIDVKHISEDKIWIKYNSLGKNDGVKYLNKFDDFIAKIIYSGLNDFV